MSIYATSHYEECQPMPPEDNPADDMQATKDEWEEWERERLHRAARLTQDSMASHSALCKALADTRQAVRNAQERLGEVAAEFAADSPIGAPDPDRRRHLAALGEIDGMLEDILTGEQP